MQEAQATEGSLQGIVERQRIMMEMAHRIRQSLKLTEILQTTVDEVRHFLQTDRVLIFQFSPDYTGTVVVESVGAEWPSRLAVEIRDECLAESYLETFRQGHITAKSDIYTANIDPCHRDLLATFQVRANLVVPILQDEHLWGLLIVHHCAAPRQWQTLEMDLLRQLALQLGIAIQQSHLFEQVQAELRDRMQAEADLKIQTESLQKSEVRYRLLFESTPNPMWVFDQASLAFLEVNQAAIDHYGYSKAEFLQMTIADILPPQDISAAHQTALTLLAGQSHTGIWQHCKKDGGLIDVEITAHIIVLGDKPAALVLVTDITERRQAEQQIREQAALIDIATDAIFICDLECRILFWNQGAERLYGWSAAEVMGQDATVVIRPEGEYLAQILHILLDRDSWQGAVVSQTKTDQIVNVESRFTLMRDETGQPKSILAVNTDMTQRKQMESQFLHAQRLESLGTLASGIAHDLNNILTPILAIAQLLPLKLPDLDEPSQHLLQILQDSSRRGSDLVSQILAFARGAESNQVMIQVGHLLLEVGRVAKQTFPKSIVVREDVPSLELLMVMADATQMHQIFMNLCINARDAMPNGGTLSLEAKNITLDANYIQVHLDAKAGPYVMITIADTGTGIAPEVLDRVFEPFFTTKEVGQGTGLGLSTVLTIIKQHGGFVTVYSELNRGTRFLVYLPAVASAIMTQIPEDLNTLAGNNELILVVDDEAAIREVTKLSLEAHNYRVITASDGIDAFSVYAEYKHEVSIVMLDLMMPTLDIATIIQTLQRINPQVQIIAMSGLPLSPALSASNPNAIKAFLPKPFTSDDLLYALHQVIQSCLPIEYQPR
jgi:two-component system, cell cycle sensor histidine kinase and response regulator CckA